MRHRDPTFDTHQVRSTAVRHGYLDDLFHDEGAEEGISGRGIAMTAEKSTCHNCGKQGPYARVTGTRTCYKDKASNINLSPEGHDKQKNSAYYSRGKG